MCRRSKQIAKPPLRGFQPVQSRRIALGNGMVIFLQEDRELPLIQATLRIRGGSREEDAAKVGLVSIYGQAWRTGGTRKRTGDELDDYLLHTSGADLHRDVEAFRNTLFDFVSTCGEIQRQPVKENEPSSRVWCICSP